MKNSILIMAKNGNNLMVMIKMMKRLWIDLICDFKLLAFEYYSGIMIKKYDI